LGHRQPDAPALRRRRRLAGQRRGQGAARDVRERRRPPVHRGRVVREAARDLGGLHGAQAARLADRPAEDAHGEPLGPEPAHAHQLQRPRSRGLELRQPADRTQLRRRAVSTEPELLVLGVGGAVKEAPMSIQKLSSTAVIAATLSLLSATACDIDVSDLNNPGLDELEQNPTRVTVTSACTGMLIGNRRNRAQANGYIAQLGILGREAYSFDPADPRFINELLKGKLAQGSPFGGNFWALPYANIRLANIVERVVSRVPDFSAEEVSGILGYSKTIEA